MIGNLIKKIFGTSHERELKRLQPLVARINQLEEIWKKKSDAELRDMTVQFWERLDNGEPHENLLPEAFATVREASRRGALVRLGQWASGSWEQQLVRALGDDRASVYFDGCGDGPQVEAMAAELNAWAEQWEQDQAGQVGKSLSLLASPVMWQAPESLAQVLRRLLHPAAQLAAGLAAGRPAPRMLPVSSWQPASTSARGRVARMAGVAGRQLATRAA